MGTFEELVGMADKFILERGSAKLFKERIFALNDELVQMRRMLSDTKQELLSAEVCNSDLKTKIDEYLKEINRLNEVVKVFTENKSVKEIPNICKDILRKIYNKTNEHINFSYFCSEFDKDEHFISYHIDFLIDNKFIISNYALNLSTNWSYVLTKKGRDYMIENNLV